VLVVDTGVLVGLLSATDDWHDRCAELFESHLWDEHVIPSTVLVELDYWLAERLPLAARRAFYEDLRNGLYRIEWLGRDDYLRSVEIIEQYSHLKLQLVDASVVALCERLGEVKVATIDRRDFRQIVPSHCDALTLFPVGPDVA